MGMLLHRHLEEAAKDEKKEFVSEVFPPEPVEKKPEKPKKNSKK